jgi:hypothetical protein
VESDVAAHIGVEAKDNCYACNSQSPELLHQQHLPRQLQSPKEQSIQRIVTGMESTNSSADEPSSLLEQLGGLLRQTSQQKILPRFQNLADGDIACKASKEDPNDVGTVFSKFMPKELAQDLERRREGHIRETAILCAAHQYTRLCRGQKDYDVYYRLMPWDHAPGALILRETGGVSRHPDGRDYQVSARREVLLTARSETIWQKVRADLFGG